MSMERKKTRHFHAGKLRKTIGATEFVEVAESNPSIDAASRATGTNRCSISRVLHGHAKTAGGYGWEVIHG